jgi:hypothetical protein
MKYQLKIKLAFISAIIASICWVIGDMFVAGFNVNPEKYPLFSQTYADKVDVVLATLMLEGSTERLMFGALIAAMTAVLFLPAIWLVYQYIKQEFKSKWIVWSNYYLLVLSVLLMPLGHAVYYYVGEIHKAIYFTDQIAHPYLLEIAKGFTMSLYITWGTAIIVMFLGWIIYAIFIFTGKTSLPKWFGFFTPFFLTLYQHPILYFMPSSDLKGWITSAGFNISYLIFFSLLFILFRKQLLQSNSNNHD